MLSDWLPQLRNYSVHFHEPVDYPIYASIVFYILSYFFRSCGRMHRYDWFWHLVFYDWCFDLALPSVTTIMPLQWLVMYCTIFLCLHICLCLGGQWVSAVWRTRLKSCVKYNRMSVYDNNKDYIIIHAWRARNRVYLPISCIIIIVTATTAETSDYPTAGDNNVRVA